MFLNSGSNLLTSSSEVAKVYGNSRDAVISLSPRNLTVLQGTYLLIDTSTNKISKCSLLLHEKAPNSKQRRKIHYKSLPNVRAHHMDSNTTLALAGGNKK
jgi:hypothetical protein